MSFKPKKSRISSLMMILFFTVVLAGCANPNNPDGIAYRLFVIPIGRIIEWLAELFSGNFGVAIILITILVRVVLLPLTFRQLKQSTRQSVRMQKVQPYLKEIQDRQKNAATDEEKMAAAREQQDFFKENNISLIGGMGCLPLLIQLPIISGLYTAIRVSEPINNSTFFGMSLGETSIVLGVLTVLIYAAQSWVSMMGMAEEQKSQMKTTMFMMPLMMAFIVFTTPAGLTLYFFTGAVWAILQSLYTNLVFRPKITAEVEKELAEKPIKQPKSAATSGSSTIKDVTNSAPKNSNKSRNIGKQNK